MKIFVFIYIPCQNDWLGTNWQVFNVYCHFGIIFYGKGDMNPAEAQVRGNEVPGHHYNHFGCLREGLREAESRSDPLIIKRLLRPATRVSQRQTCLSIHFM
jgi:hypothetical protein